MTAQSTNPFEAGNGADSTNRPSSPSAHEPSVSPLPQSLPALLYRLAHPMLQASNTLRVLEQLRHTVQAYRVHASGIPLPAAAPQPFQHDEPASKQLALASGPLDADALVEAESGAHVIRHVLDRMQRLRGAYGEWQHFDAPAYFDLTQEQAGLLIEVAERVTAVHVTFFADLLFPSFRAALHLWAGEGTPASLHNSSAEAYERYAEQALPALHTRWQHAMAIIEQTRRLLAADIGYLAANGADEERWRWLARAGSTASARPAPVDAPSNLLPMERIPTLTLTMDFPLPAFRQPGRLRRLRKNRDLAARRKRR